MGDRFNTWAGWALFAGIIALGGGIVSSQLFHQERPEEMGYAIEGVEAEGEGAADAGPPLPVLLAKADGLPHHRAGRHERHRSQSAWQPR
jgi:cytochrome c